MIKAVFDTNVWLDYFLNRSSQVKAIVQLLTQAAQGHIVVYTSPLTIKDVFYLQSNTLKAEARRADGSLSESMARAVNEVAWACIVKIREFSLIAPVGSTSVFNAFAYRSGTRQDFEDNLLVAAVADANADYLVTGDKRLLAQTAVPAVTPAELAKKLAS